MILRSRQTFLLGGIAAGIIFSLSFSGPALATGIRVNTGEPVVSSGSLAISGSRIVWCESRSEYTQVFYRDMTVGGAPIQLSPSVSSNQVSPAIYGDIIVWQEGGDLFYKNVTAGGAVQITDNGGAYPKYQPTIYGDRVAWYEEHDGQDQIYVKRLADPGNGTAVDPGDTTTDQRAPSLTARYLVWEAWSGVTTHLRYKNITSGLFIPFDLCTAAGNQNAPSLEDTLVAWEDTRLGHAQIYSYDLAAGPPGTPSSAGVRVSATDLSNQTEPVVSANRVAWTDDINGSDADIYLKDLAQGFATVNLAPDALDQDHAVMSGDKVAWESYRQDSSGLGWDVHTLKTDPVAVCYSGFEVGSAGGPDSGWTVGKDAAFPEAADAYWGESTKYRLAGNRSLWMAGYGGDLSDPPNPKYVDNMRGVISRQVDLTGYTGASFGFSFVSKMAESDANDRIYVEVRDASGINSIPGIADATLEPITAGWPSAWQDFSVSLVPAAGQVVTIRLYAVTDPSGGTDAGSYIDDLYVSGFSTWPAAVPTGTVAVIPTDPGAPGFVTSAAVTLYVDAADFTGSQLGMQMQFSNNGSDWSAPEPYAAFKLWNLDNASYGGTSTEGAKTVYAKFIDILGMPSADPQAMATINLDSTAPTEPAVGISGSPETVTTPLVNLVLSAADDDPYGVALMQFSNDGTHWSDWEDYGLLHEDWDLTDSDYGGTSGSGTKTVYARFKDPAGNTSQPSPAASVVYQSIVPTGTVSFNSGAPYTNIAAVTLSVTAEASGAATITDMRFSDSNGGIFTDETWIGSFVSTYAWTLPAGDGTKTIYAQFRDSLDRVSNTTISDTITFDTAPPTLPTIVTADPHLPSAWTNDNTVTVSWSGATDALSGVDSVARVWSQSDSTVPDPDEDLAPAAGTSTRTWSSPSPVNNLYFHLRIRDNAGNWSATVHRGPYFIDTEPPTGSVVIDGGATTENNIVDLTLDCADGAGSGLWLMQFSNNGSDWSSWETYGTHKTGWDINDPVYGGVSEGGTKTVYVKLWDIAGNKSTATITDTIGYSEPPDITAPTGAVTINGGAMTTTSNVVMLTLSSDDPGIPSSGVASMRFSNDGATWSPWETVDNVKHGWNLTSGYGATSDYGTKTVYVKFIDNAGSESTAVISDSIILINSVPVHRFYNYLQGVHFYTTNSNEKNYLEGPGGNWTFRLEGVAFSAYADDVTNSVPVHRFYNFLQGVHFYTANQAEATHVNDNLSGTFRYEGVAYYAYPESYGNPAEMAAVHRFYNFIQGVHFYTANQAEATNVNDNLWHTYRYEGVAYYVP